MFFDLIRALPAALLVGVLPGWFWSRLLVDSGDRAERFAHSVALSLALVPAVALVLAGALGTGVTLAVAVAAPLLVFVCGLVASLRFAPFGGMGGKSRARPDAPPVAPSGATTDALTGTPPVGPLGVAALAPVVLALGLVLVSDLGNLRGFWLAGSCWGWPDLGCSLSGEAQAFLVPVALLLVAAGVAHLFASRRGAGPSDPSEGREAHGAPAPPVASLARRLALPVVLLLALVRGYSGPVLHDWPFVRGVDLYSHTVMTNLTMAGGDVESYLIYPPGLHTTIALVSRLGGLDPLDVFPALGPAALLLPALALYVLGKGLWGWGAGVAASAFSVLLGGTYYFYNDAMYPNLVASQFLMVLAVAALVRLYRAPSPRAGLLLAVLGSAVVLFHQVSSLYLAALLALVGALFLPYLLLRERRKGLTLLLSFALLGLLSVAYAWDTYDLPRLVGSLIGVSGGSETGDAVGMAVGSQVPYEIGTLVGAIVSQPVAWLGLLGVALVAAGLLGGRADAPQVMAHATLLLWALLLFAGSRTSLSGFPQRFGRDLGVPLALFAALALVAILATLHQRRKTSTVLVATLALVLAASLVGLRMAQGFGQAAGESPFVMMTPEIAAAGEWLEEHNKGGNIMVSPHGTSIPSRMMLAMGDYSALQSFPAPQIRKPRDLPPTGPDPLRDVLRVLKRPDGKRAGRLLEEHDVRYVVLYKYTPLEGPTEEYWPEFKAHPDLYETEFENRQVLIVAPRGAR